MTTPALTSPSFQKHPLTRMGGKVMLDAIGAIAAMLLAQSWTQSHIRLGAREWSWILILLILSYVFRVTSQHYRTFGLRDLTVLFVSFLASIFLLPILIAALPESRGSSAGAFWVATTLTHVFWIGIRLTFLVAHDRTQFLYSNSGQNMRPTLIVGGGRAGLLVAQELSRHPELNCKLVGFLDDALDKQGVLIQGSPVLGTTHLLASVMRDYGIKLVVLAIPTAPGQVIRDLSSVAEHSGAHVKTVPGIYRLLGGETWKPSLQDISIDDLLRRAPVQLDQAALGEALKNKTVLVTGGGGSIGSEIARQVAPFNPARIVLLGRGEGSLWQAEQSLRQAFPGLPLTLELVDIRNKRRLNQAFRRWRPEVIFHAAAHKHVPYLEEHPEEAIENNIFGTQNVVEAAMSINCNIFVNISTDKAINPTNVLGASKYIAERIVLKASLEATRGQRYASVRFGNVLGSRGSVIPIFRHQIQQGGPLTVTHPEMKRYFMTIPEAAQLVLLAGLMGKNGRVYVLDMGAPVKIVDLAIDMAKLAGMEVGLDIDLNFTGIRPGEKLFEELFNGHETICQSIHPQVREAEQKPIDFARLNQVITTLVQVQDHKVESRRSSILQLFVDYIPGYTSSADGLGRYSIMKQD